MSITLALYNAVSSLQVNQIGLSTTSQNVSNANTEGYSRKVLAVENRIVDGRGIAVDVSSIFRVVDRFLVGEMRRQLSEYSSLGFDLGGGYRTIDRGDPRFLQEGGQGAFRFWAQRRVGQSSTFGTFYSASRSLIVDPSTTIQTLSGGFGFLPEGRNVSLRLSGGASYYLAENGISSITPVADATFAAGLTRTTQLSAMYRRQFSQSLGFGSTLLIDYASVSLSQEFGSKVDLTLLGGGTFGSDPLIEGSRYDAVQAGGTLTYRVVESFRIGTSFFVLKTEQTNFGVPSETKRNLASVFVTYTATWR